MVETPFSGKVLLAKAYQLKGDIIKARSLLQGYIYNNLVGAMGAFPDMMTLYADEPDKCSAWLQKAIDLGDLFEIDRMLPTSYFSIYLAAAQSFIMQGNKKSALDMLEKYVGVLTNLKPLPLKFHGNDLFDSLDDLFASLDLGSQPPRSDEVILQSIKEAVLNNPAFEGLHEEVRYQELAARLSQL